MTKNVYNVKICYQLNQFKIDNIDVHLVEIKIF